MTIERFSASVAGRHMACHASANLELAIPGWQPPPPRPPGAAGAGTSIHGIVEQLFAIKTTTATRETKFNAKDMLAFARILTYIGELWSTRRFSVLVEQSFTAAWLPQPTSTTPDLVLYTQDEVHLLDMKWGKIPVEVVGNPQLLFYDVCVAALAPKAKGVTNHILQPRADNMESWFADTNVIRDFRDEAIATQRSILAGSTTFGVSDDCKFCPAFPHSRGEKGQPLCPEAMRLLYPKHVDEDAILAL